MNEKSEAQLFCHVAEDTGSQAADDDIKALRKGNATYIIKVVSEMYFHMLRLEVAFDPEFAKRIKVVYQGQELHLDRSSEGFWPPDFLQTRGILRREIDAERNKGRIGNLPNVADADIAIRNAFEAGADAYGFDLTRYGCAAPEPWSEYADAATGHRWGGWLAALDESELLREQLSGAKEQLAAAVTRIAELQIWHDDVMNQRVSQMFPDFPELIIRPKPLKGLK